MFGFDVIEATEMEVCAALLLSVSSPLLCPVPEAPPPVGFVTCRTRIRIDRLNRLQETSTSTVPLLSHGFSFDTFLLLWRLRS